eukprot:327847_1
MTFTVEGNKSELAATLAAMVVGDGGNDVSADKMDAVIKAAGLKVDKIWTQVFAETLEGQDITGYLKLGGGGGGGAAAAPAAGGAAAAAEPEPEEEEEEEEEDM